MICASIVSSFCGLLLAAIVISTTSNNWKLCCDKECKEPISFARATGNNYRRDVGYLSFPRNARITIFAKSVAGDEDVWEGEFNDKRGYIKRPSVEETKVQCHTPQERVPVRPPEGHTPPAEPEHHDTDNGEEKARVVSETGEGQESSNMQTNDRNEGLDLPPDTPPAVNSGGGQGDSYHHDNQSVGNMQDGEGSDVLSEGDIERDMYNDDNMEGDMQNHDDTEDGYNDDDNEDDMEGGEAEGHVYDEGETEVNQDNEQQSNDDFEDSLMFDQDGDSGAESHDAVESDDSESTGTIDSDTAHINHQNVESQQTETQNPDSDTYSPDTDADSDSYTGTHIVDDSVPHTDSDSRTDLDSHTDPDFHSNTNADSDSQTDPDSHFHKTDADPPDSNSSTDLHSDTDPPDPNSDSHTETDPHTEVSGFVDVKAQSYESFAESHSSATSEISTTHSDTTVLPFTESSSEFTDSDIQSSAANIPPIVSDSTADAQIPNAAESDSQTAIPNTTESHSQTAIPNTAEFDSQTSVPSSSESSAIPSTTGLDSQTSVSINSESSAIPNTNFQTSIPSISESSAIPNTTESDSQTSIPSSSESSAIPNAPPEVVSSGVLPSQSVDSRPPVVRTQTPLRHLSSKMNERTRSSTPHDTPPTPLHPPHKEVTQREAKWEDVPVIEKQWRESTDPQEVDEVLKSDRSMSGKKYIIDSLSDKVVSFLPSSFGEQWVLALGPDAGLIAIVTTSVAMILPLCCLCVRASKRASKASKMLNSEMSRKRNTDAFLTNIRKRAAKLEKDNDQLEDELTRVKEQLEIEKQGNWDLENTRSTLEQDKSILIQRLSTIEQEMAQDKSNLKKITSELQQTMVQMTAVLEEKAHALLQVTQLNSQLEEAVLNSQELEAAKQQLEQDCYTVRTSLDELKLEHNKLYDEKCGLHDKVQQLVSEVQTLTGDNSTLQQTLANKEQEVNALKECVTQLSEDQQSDNSDNGDNRKLEVVKNLLDTTKVRTELNEVCQERDKLRQELQDQESVLTQLRTENESLQSQINSVTSSEESLKQEFVATEMKLKAITEYFEQKETQLHRKIGEEEMVRQRVESREAYAKERAEHAESEREKEREELKELRKQMGDIEKSLMQQVVTNEKRAEEALSQLRRTEQELRAANKEVTALKRRLEDMRRSPSPPGARPPVMRPLPAPDMRRSPLPPMAAARPPPGYRPGYGPRPPLGGFRPMGPLPPGPMGPPPPGHMGPPPPGHMGPPPPGHMGPPPPGPMGPPPRSSSPLEDAEKSRERPLPPRPRSAVNDIHGYYGDDTSRNSRQTPPGMESHDPYRPRPDYPPPMHTRDRPRHYDEDPRQGRPLSRYSLNDSMDESHDDRPPVPGTHGYPPPLSRPYAPRDPYYRPRPPPPDRQRPPSGPQHAELSRSFDQQRDFTSRVPPPLLNQSAGPTPTSVSVPAMQHGHTHTHSNAPDKQASQESSLPQV